MDPITRGEIYMAAAAGEYSGELPEPITRSEFYWQKIAQRIDAGGSVSPESIDAAIEDYLNSHDADIVTEAELTEALEGKADSADIPDVSGFIGVDVNNLTNYYDKDTVDAALAGKQAALTAGENITIADNNGDLTISATDTTYSAATTSADGLMSAADKAKLDGIAATAEVNVQADWSQTDSEADDYIQNKPDLSIYAESSAVTTALSGKVDKETGKSLMTADEHTKLTGIESGAQVNTVTGVKGNAENNYRTGEINISPANIGLGNVDNTSDANKPISTATQTALDGKQNVLTFDNSPTENSDNPVKSGGVYSALAGKISTSAKGANGGVAELDATGKIPSSQMPSSVDNILEYPTLNDFPTTGEDRKIYIALDTKLTYRWGGTEYGEISPSIALGTTSSTAYRGDWGAEDRAAIGRLTDLQTSAKSSLVAAVNEVKTALGNVQSSLTFDNVPTSGSENPVKSGGIYTALAGKQDTLTIDSAPTSGSENPVESGGVYTALSGKQNTLTFDSTPTENSTNPVTSGGIYNALAGKQNSLTIDGSPTENSTNPVTSGSVYTALSGKADATATQTALNSKADATATQTALAGKQNALTAGANITIETVNDALTISATDTTYSDATQQTHGLMSTADKTKLDGVQTGATAVSVTQTLASGTKIGTVTVNGTGTDLYCETNTDTTYSAGTGLLLSGTTFSNSAPNVKSDWNAAAGTDAEILNKPTIPSYSNATASAAGLMSADDKTKLNACKKIVVCNSESDYISLTKDSDTVYMILEETT